MCFKKMKSCGMALTTLEMWAHELRVEEDEDGFEEILKLFDSKLPCPCNCAPDSHKHTKCVCDIFDGQKKKLVHLFLVHTIACDKKINREKCV